MRSICHSQCVLCCYRFKNKSFAATGVFFLLVLFSTTWALLAKTIFSFCRMGFCHLLNLLVDCRRQMTCLQSPRSLTIFSFHYFSSFWPKIAKNPSALKWKINRIFFPSNSTKISIIILSKFTKKILNKLYFSTSFFFDYLHFFFAQFNCIMNCIRKFNRFIVHLPLNDNNERGWWLCISTFVEVYLWHVVVSRLGYMSIRLANLAGSMCVLLKYLRQYVYVGQIRIQA